MPFDENAKDASRMFYAPAKADAAAPYICHLEPGAFLDWQSLCLDAFAASEDAKVAAAEQTTAVIRQIRQIRFLRTMNDTLNFADESKHRGKIQGAAALFSEHSILSDERLLNQTRAERAEQNDKEPQPLRVVRMSDVKAEQISWLWFPYIALGKVTLLSGFEVWANLG